MLENKRNSLSEKLQKIKLEIDKIKKIQQDLIQKHHQNNDLIYSHQLSISNPQIKIQNLQFFFNQMGKHLLKSLGKFCEYAAKPIINKLERQVIHSVVPREQRKMFDKYIGAPAKLAYRGYQQERKERKAQRKQVSQQAQNNYQKEYEQRIQQLEMALAKLVQENQERGQSEKIQRVQNRINNEKRSHHDFLNSLNN